MSTPAGEEVGSGHITITLDSDAAEGEAERLGDSIQRILDRASRRAAAAIQRNIRNGLRAIGTPSVQVAAQLDDDALRARLDALQGAVVDVTARLDAAVVQAQLDALRGVTVDVTAELDASAVRAQLDGLRGAAVVVVARLDSAAFQAALSRLRGATVDVTARLDASAVQAQLDALRGVTVDVTARLDAASAEGAVDRLGDSIESTLTQAARDAGLRMQREINAAVRRISPVRVRVEADLRAFGHSIDTLRSFDPVPLPVVPDIDRARFEAAIQAALGGLEASVRLIPDVDMSRVDAAIRAYNPPDVTVDVNADVDRGLGRSLSSIGGVLLSVAKAAAGSGVALAKFGAVAAAATGAVVVLGNALGPALGAVAALPAVALGGAAALTAFKLATNGVGDALKAAASGDAEKLADALEKLSPSAREAVGAFAALQPRLKALQQSVQEAFFTRFSDQVEGAFKNLLPLQSALGGISAQFGRAASEGLKFAASKDALAALRPILAGTHAALSGLAPATQPVLKGFLDVAAAVSTAFGQQVGTSIRDTGQRLGEFLTRLADTGRAVDLVRGAADVFRDLKGIVVNVGGILKGVFDASGGLGSGLLDRVRDITGAIKDMVNSAEGQSTLSILFDSMRQAGDALRPVFDNVAGLIRDLAPQVQDMVNRATPVIKKLGDGLDRALRAAGPGLKRLADSVVGLFDRLAESGEIERLGESLGKLGRAAADLINGPLGQLAIGVLGVFNDLVSFVSDGISGIILFFDDLDLKLNGLADSVEKWGQDVKQSFLDMWNETTRFFTEGIDRVTALVSSLFNEITTNVAMGAAEIVAFFAGLPGRITGGLSALVSTVTGFFVRMWTSAVATVAGGIDSVVRFFRELPGRAAAALSSLGGFLAGKFNAAKSAVLSAVSSMVGSAVGFFRSLPGRAASAVSSIVGTLSGVFNSARSAVLGRVTSLVASAVRLVRELPGRAASALSGLGGRLASAGAELINGFISGIRSKIGEVRDTLGGLTSKLTDWKGPRQLDKVILTPAGRAVIDGFVRGLESVYPAVRKSLGGLTKQLAKAVESGKVRFAEPFLASLESGTGRLKSLTAQRERLLDRIKAANEFAAQTAQSALQSFSLQSLAENGGGVQGLTDGIEAAIKKVQAFNRQINALAKRGLRRDLLSQLIGLGPDQGAGLASTLSKATGAQIKDLNEAQKQLSAAATKLGRDSSDVLFDSGVNAGKGFLAGLESQRKQIERVMTDIARSLAKTIRRELAIRSPSRVMALIGRQTMQGLRLGVDDQVPAVGRSALRAASALTDPFGAGVSAPRIGGRFGAAGTSTGGAAAGGAVTNSTTSTARTVTINQTINEVGSAEATAQRILNRLAASGVGL